MPWKIKEQAGEFCVVKKAAPGGKEEVKKCYSQRSDAEAYLKALYANAEESMSIHVSNLEAPSLSDRLAAISRAFHSMGQADPNPYDCYIKEVYDTYLLVDDGMGSIYKVGYTMDDAGNVSFDKVGDWKKQKLVDAQISGFQFVELATATSSFDGLAASEDVAFVSMSGEELFVQPGDLETYMQNGQAIIDSTRDSTGEPVGLPIDMGGHDHKGGAGWIKGFELDAARNVIRFMVEWTKDGAELIKNNTTRFFSPSIDPIRKVILGGSLTNWPATRNSMGALLLKPIELSVHMKGITMPTIEETLTAIQARLAELEKPKETVADPAAPPDPASPPSGEEIDLEIKRLLGDDDAVDQLRNLAQAKAQELVRVATRKSHVVEFVSRVVGGTPANPVGLPVTARELTKLLLSLPEKQSLAVERILAKVWDSALDFSEHGIREGDQFNLRKPVPPQYVELVQQWVDSGKSAKSFFEINPEAGNAEDYNLSAFKMKEA